MAQDQRVRVKICGITRIEDALVAAHAGVDAIGLVFYAPSSRHVSVEQARRIVAELPPFVSVVGLFVDETAEVVRSVTDQVALDILQFHGNESAAYCRQFKRRYIKAVRMQANVDLAAISRDHAQASAVLVDTFVKGQVGGTGQTFDWRRLPAERECPLILAGGLDPDNVTQAIRSAAPWGVDVSGGVEFLDENGKRHGGVKSPQAINAFMEGVASA